MTMRIGKNALGLQKKRGQGPRHNNHKSPSPTANKNSSREYEAINMMDLLELVSSFKRIAKREKKNSPKRKHWFDVLILDD